MTVDNHTLPASRQSMRFRRLSAKLSSRAAGLSLTVAIIRTTSRSLCADDIFKSLHSRGGLHSSQKVFIASHNCRV